MSTAEPRQGRLVVVGTGIKLLAHLTPEARDWIERADKLYYVVADPVMAVWLQRRNPSAESLTDLYVAGQRRRATYAAMADRLLTAVRAGQTVCAVFYGHPGVFVDPSHIAIQQAREEGFQAEMLPGISAEDCLFADLGVDPAASGCQSYEATNFLLYRRPFSPHTPLILWQIGVVGHVEFQPERYENRGLALLGEHLAATYGDDHEVTIYEAAQYAILAPRIERRPLGQLARTPVAPVATLYVPPLAQLPVDKEMLHRLGLERATL